MGSEGVSVLKTTGEVKNNSELQAKCLLITILLMHLKDNYIAKIITKIENQLKKCNNLRDGNFY